ncbi:hypothetical protein [Pseudomonas veronii]
MANKVQNGQRIVYQTDASGVYVGESLADPDPKNNEQWLIPAGCVEIKPPAMPRGKKAQWVGYKWKLIDM